MELSSCADVTQYYEAFLAPTAHEGRDPTPLANGYAWAVEIMENLRPLDIVNATRTRLRVAPADEAGLHRSHTREDGDARCRSSIRRPSS